MYVCMYVRMYVCMYVCIYGVCTCVHGYVHTPVCMYGTAQFKLDQAHVQQNMTQHVLHVTYMYTCVCTKDR